MSSSPVPLPAADRNQLRRRLHRLHGHIAHMYLSPTGHVAVAAGYLLFNSDQALLLGFVDTSGHRAAVDAVRDDYQRIRQLPRSTPVACCAHLSRLRLPAHEVARLNDARITSAHRELRELFDDFDDFPQPARLALFDMVFAHNGKILAPAQPPLRGSIAAGNWLAAAAHTWRPAAACSHSQRYVSRLFAQAALYDHHQPGRARLRQGDERLRLQDAGSLRRSDGLR